MPPNLSAESSSELRSAGPISKERFTLLLGHRHCNAASTDKASMEAYSHVISPMSVAPIGNTETDIAFSTTDPIATRSEILSR